MHDSRAYQCEVSTRYMYLWRAYAAYAWWHVWRRTRQATTCVTNACFQPHVNQLHWWSPRWISASCGNLFFSRTWIILWSWHFIVHTHMILSHYQGLPSLVHFRNQFINLSWKYVLMAELRTFFWIYRYDLWRKMPTNQPYSKMLHCFQSIVW